jgi:hypothetical protein
VKAREQRNYNHRDVLDKLGIKPGYNLAFVPPVEETHAELCRRVAERAGRPPADDEPADIVLAFVDDHADPVALLGAWRPRLRANGAIWLLTPKRGQPCYVKQDDLIPAGLAAGLVDNKICSVSGDTSAMRFVIRRKDRPPDGAILAGADPPGF